MLVRFIPLPYLTNGYTDTYHGICHVHYRLYRVGRVRRNIKILPRTVLHFLTVADNANRAVRDKTERVMTGVGVSGIGLYRVLIVNTIYALFFMVVGNSFLHFSFLSSFVEASAYWHPLPVVLYNRLSSCCVSYSYLEHFIA